jgi:uncharacterized protein (TIGR00288 family)
MISPFTRAPHQGGVASGVSDSPHAALLIDFDNVTMGMRSDLSKELKTLLGSDVIKGKVSVQRAYADWRRYPQYIVPLSEASVDLIFAPAYGSNKKNATDIRMAIDAVELVFTRPEIGTYILLTGDSDFSSLVLKLKEYGKYVIGVGIQESTSDILVQNCDEYYSYTSLSGLRKTTEADQRTQDPWVLVKEALKRMADRDDVMRSDRLKQVMQEIDPTFDESGLGFSKFSKFLTEASSRGLVKLHKLDNGQYEVSAGGRGRRDDSDEREPRRDRGRSRGERRERGPRARSAAEEPGPAPTAQVEAYEASEADGASGAEDPLRAAYALMTRSLEELRDAGRDPVRDSDVKRKMLEVDGSFDEAELGFSKFSKFLSQAEDHDVIRLLKTEAGNYEVTLADGPAPTRAKVERSTEPETAPTAGEGDRHREEGSAAAASAGREATPSGPSVIDIEPSDLEEVGRRLGPRRGSTRRRHDDEGLSLFEGQAVSSPSGGHVYEAEEDDRPEPGEAGPLDAAALGLPTEPDAIARYLTHRYRGVGEKTAESLVERFGTELFRVLRDDPEAIREAVTPKRAEQVLEAWQTDYERRIGRRSGGGNGTGGGDGRPERGGRRGGRRRGSRGRSES